MSFNFSSMMRRILIWNKIATCQTLSGTGALHLAWKIIKCCQTSALPEVYIPDPMRSNHHFVFSSLGFESMSFSYDGHESRNLDIHSYFSTLRIAEPGSVIILHACAHNQRVLTPALSSGGRSDWSLKSEPYFRSLTLPIWASTRVTTTRMCFQLGSSSMT
jgi:aspartate/tyrosine/aromatic aminotransferase